MIELRGRPPTARSCRARAARRQPEGVVRATFRRRRHTPAAPGAGKSLTCDLLLIDLAHRYPKAATPMLVGLGGMTVIVAVVVPIVVR